MNFDRIPELEWPLGYPFALALAVVAAVSWFRRRGWF
jgi:magnesium transporter